MSIFRLIKNSLIYYWAISTGVFLAVVLSTAVITGALMMDDCVRMSLTKLVDARLGRIHLALFSGDRFFRVQLADEVGDALDSDASATLSLRGTIVNSEATRRVNHVEVLGVDESFFKTGQMFNPFDGPRDEGIVINRTLADRLEVDTGDEVVLRISRPSLVPRESVVGS